MSIVYYKEITGRDGEVDEENRTWTRVWRVKTTSRLQGAALISQELGQDPNFPKIGSAHPADADSKARRIRITDLSPIHWIVSVFYSDKDDISDEPTEDPPVITWDGDEVQRPFIEDIHGDAVLNSAGQPFEDLQYDDSRMVATIVANVSEVPSDILEFRNVINDEDVLIDGVLFEANTARIKKIPISEKKKRNDIEYRTLTIKVFYDAGTWSKSILDQGTMELDPADATKRRLITLDDGTHPDGPVPLDGAGAMLANPTPATAVFLTKDVYPLKDFSTLPGIEPVI